MNIRDALLKYKEFCKMDDARWLQFCRRYSQKCTPTIVAYIREAVGELPPNPSKKIEEELASFLSKP